MARILFLTLLFSPDGVSTAQLMTELALGLRELGNEVTVITATPHYNEDTEARGKQPLRRCFGGLLYRSEIEGLEVLHVPVRKKGSRILSRVIDHLCFHSLSTIAGLTVIGKQDLVFAPTPPLTIGLNAWMLGSMRRIPFVYNVQEIFPDVVKDLGLLRNKRVYRLLERIEKFTYDRAVTSVVISEWFQRNLLEKGVEPRKVRVIPNFVDTEFMRPQARQNSFSAAHDLSDKFVVLYAGNIGISQGFETIVETAERLADMENIRFLIVGDGARRAWLEGELERRGTGNITLLPYQARSLVPLIYASSDLCLVPLKRGIAGSTFPSKIYTIMAAGRPALASADEDSELAWLVRDAGCGFLVKPEDVEELAETIVEAYRNRERLQEMGMNGRAYVEENYSRQAVVSRYHELFSALLAEA